MRVQDGRVLETLKGGPLRQVDIARAMDVGQSSVQARLTRLHKQGSVVRGDGAMWSLTPTT
jgi:Mn-dependent DtxR family transcriptional regulator